MTFRTTRPREASFPAAPPAALLAALLSILLPLAAQAAAPAVEAPPAQAATPAAATATERPGPPPNLAEIAASLPPLPRDGDTVALPLAADGGPGQPTAWSPIREGVEVADGGDGLEVSFTVATGQPAGAALIVPPGTFAGVATLHLTARANRNAPLMVTLQDADGAAFVLPSVALRVGNARHHELHLEDARYLDAQSTAPDPGRLDPARVVMVTLLDPTGFMSRETPRVEWVVEGLEGVAP